LDANYFYGDFLYEQHEYPEAIKVLKHALTLPAPPPRPPPWPPRANAPDTKAKADKRATLTTRYRDKLFMRISSRLRLTGAFGSVLQASDCKPRDELGQFIDERLVDFNAERLLRE
jgi:hypothetical protein